MGYIPISSDVSSDVFKTLSESIEEIKIIESVPNKISYKVIENKKIINNLIAIRNLRIEMARKEIKILKMSYIYGLFGLFPGDKIRVKSNNDESDFIVSGIRIPTDVFDLIVDNFDEFSERNELELKNKSIIIIKNCETNNDKFINYSNLCKNIIKNYNKDGD